MKKIIVFLHVLIFTCTTFAAEISTEAKITNVTVYLQGATIYTTSNLEIPQGVSQITITKQSQFIDANSLQVSGKGNFTILGVQAQLNYLEKQDQNKKIKDLESQKKSLVLQTKQFTDELQVYSIEEKLLEKNMELKGQNTSLAVLELEKAANFYRTRLMEIKKKKLDITEKNTIIQEQIIDIENQLQQLRSVVNQPTGEIIVMVSSKTAQNIQLQASYFMANASWTPYYDMRVKDVAGPVNITYKATINQFSGVEWNNVKVTLSTGNPTLGGTAPTLFKWLLIRQNPPQVKYKSAPSMMKSEVRADMDMPMPVYAETEEIQNSVSLGYSNKKASYNMAQVAQKMTTTEFEIDDPITIKTDGKQAFVTINEYNVPAQYIYVCVPKLDTDAFLVANVTGYESYNFLSGNANLYFEGAYVGESYIDLDRAQDTLQLSLGRDKGIAVERKRVDDFSAKKVLGGKRKELQTWEITVKNNKQAPISIEITDQIPVSGQSEIEVTDISYPDGTIDKETSNVLWKLTVDKGTSKKVKISYQITYPKDWIVNTK